MTERFARALHRIGLAMIVAAFFVVAAVWSARAHEWYPPACCSGVDCHPAATGDRDAREPDPVRVRGGWRLHDGIVLKDEDAKPSPDGRFHVCRTGGNPRGAVIYTDGRPCFWMPAPAI